MSPPTASAPASAPRDQLTLALCGLLLVLAFFGLTETAQGLRISFVGEANRSSAGELLFWLGAALLLLPGAAALGYAAGGAAAPAAPAWLQRLDRLLAALGPRRGASCAFAIAFAIAAIGNRVVLRGFPIADDEAFQRFGGQVLALGRLTVDLPLPLDTFPNRFVWLRGATGTSMDFPLVHVIWALAEVSHLGPLVFAPFAALPAYALTRLLWTRLSPRMALFGLLLCLASPMGFALSLTYHGHVLSRGLFSLALLFYAERDPAPRRHLILCGLCLGGAFNCRAPEIGTLGLPILISECWLWLSRGPASPDAGRRLRWLFVGGLLPLLLFLLHPLVVTGSLMPMRLVAERGPDFYAQGSLWHRFGAATSYNLLMLLVWSVGPLGLLALPLWVVGTVTDRLTRLLMLGVLTDLLVTLIHDIGGIHIVGPIHYSECLPPLILVALHGLDRGLRLLDRGPPALAPLRPALCGAALAMVLLGLGIFNGVHAMALRRQADMQADIYAAVAAQVAALGGPPVLIIAPRFNEVWAGHPAGRLGTKVFDWQRPHPDLSDPILIAHEIPGWELLRARFPGRRVLRMRATAQAPYLRLSPVP